MITDIVTPFELRSLARSSHSLIHCKYRGFAHSVAMSVDVYDYQPFPCTATNRGARLNEAHNAQVLAEKKERVGAS